MKNNLSYRKEYHLGPFVSFILILPHLVGFISFGSLYVFLVFNLIMSISKNDLAGIIEFGVMMVWVLAFPLVYTIFKINKTDLYAA